MNKVVCPQSRNKLQHKTILFVFLIFCFAGCSYTTTVNRSAGNHKSNLFTIDKLNDELRNKSVLIQMRNGHGYVAENVSVGPDSTSFLTTGELAMISNDSIEHYRWTNHFGGALEGFLLSGIPAFLLSLDRKDWEGNTVKGTSILELSLRVSTATVCGGLAGKNYYYEFSTETDDVLHP